METTSLNNATNEINAENLLREMAAESNASQQAVNGSITEGVAGWFTARYAACTHSELAAASGPRRWSILRAALRDWSVLRRSDHAAARLQLEQARVDLSREKHKHAVALADQTPKKRRNVLQPLTDEERKAIIHTIDDIMGINH